MLRHSADLMSDAPPQIPGNLSTTPRRRSKKRGTKLSWAQRLVRLVEAEAKLKAALKFTKEADAPLLAGKIRAAIKSCGGAIRHASGRESYEYHEARRMEEESDHEKVVVEYPNGYPHCNACKKVLEDCGCDGPQGTFYPGTRCPTGESCDGPAACKQAGTCLAPSLSPTAPQ